MRYWNACKNQLSLSEAEKTDTCILRTLVYASENVLKKSQQSTDEQLIILTNIFFTS